MLRLTTVSAFARRVARAARSALKAADRAATPPPAEVRAQDYRATLTVRLGSVEGMSDAMKTAIRATRAWGGYVVAANYAVPGADGDARLIVRIPVQHVQAAIQRFSDLGTLAAQDVSIRDVQAKLDGYTRDLLATRERIAKLKVKLADAETDAQRASLELQIARAQRAAAQLRAEQVALKRQASFANVTLTLTTRDAAAAAPHKEGPHRADARRRRLDPRARARVRPLRADRRRADRAPRRRSRSSAPGWRAGAPTTGCSGARESRARARRRRHWRSPCRAATARTPSGLYGAVTRGPDQPRLPCRRAVRAARGQGAMFFLIRKGTTTSVRTDAGGHYRVRLAPGRYTVSKSNWGPGGITPSSVVVPAAHFARVNFAIDTGIR